MYAYISCRHGALRWSTCDQYVYTPGWSLTSTILGLRSSSLLAPSNRNVSKISDSRTGISTAHKQSNELTANSMFHALGPSNTLSIQESPPNSDGISPQTQCLDYIRTPINTSIHVDLKWLGFLLGSIVLWGQAFRVGDRCR
jgi:hypothetical protein